MRVITSLLAATMLAATGHATILDFQALEHIDDTQQPVPGDGKSYSEDGYLFVSSSDDFNMATWGTLNENYLGSTALWNGDGTGINGVTTLSRTDGAPFDLISMQLGELNVTGPGQANVTFEGVLAGGGTVSQTIVLDGIRETGSGFETIEFEGFTDVISVSWLQLTPYHQFDDIVVESAADADAVAGAVEGVVLDLAACRNATTDQTVIDTAAPGTPSWDCTGAGLATSPGDRVLQIARGSVSCGGGACAIRGTVSGVNAFAAVCRNLTSGQSVTARAAGGSFDCTGAGLAAAEGDAVLLIIVGNAVLAPARESGSVGYNMEASAR